MKKITFVKQLTFFIALCCVVSFGYGQTTLSAGDIAITGFNSDTPDQFTFVLLKAITATTEIKFTDNGRQSIAFDVNDEGILTWTADTDLACGTEIIIEEPISNTYTTNFGNVVETGLGFALAIAGDQILAYQGLDTAPIFIYAITFGSSTWTDSDNTQTTTIPIGLTEGQDALYVGNTENGVYNCSVTINQSLILEAVSTDTNWTLSNSPMTLGGCTFTCGPCSSPAVTWSSGGWLPITGPNINTPVIIADNYDTALNSSFSACSLTVNDNATLSIADNDYIEVENELAVEVLGVIEVQPTGSFVQNNNVNLNNILGTIRVDKITAPMDAWYEYTYWSSPVSGAKFEDAISDSEPSRRFIFNGQNFLDHCAETGNNNICDDNGGLGLQDDIDDDINDWQPVAGTEVMQPGIGYATTITEFAYSIAPGPSNKTFRFTFEGPFNNGQYDIPIYRNDFELNDNNWNFIGNPYPSAIDADLFLAANAGIAQDVDGTSINGTDYIDGAIFLWSQDTAPLSTTNGNEVLNFSNDDYAIINMSGTLAGGDGVQPTRYIPSGQGFFVSYSNLATPVSTTVNGDGHTIAEGSVTFSNSMRVLNNGADNNNGQFFKNSNTKGKSNTATANKLWINLTSDNGVFNQILVGYINGATNNDDGMAYDVNKYPTKGAALYSIIEGSSKKFAIQGKDANSINEDEVINLGFKTTINVATLFKLSVAQLQGDFLTGSPIYLIDNLLNKAHDLSVCDYTFTSAVGEFNSRFEIAFTNKALSVNDVQLNTKAFKIVELQDDLVQFNTNNNLTIKAVNIYDLLGRALYQFKGETNSETFRLSNLNNTVYIAKVALSDGTVVTKKAVKK